MATLEKLVKAFDALKVVQLTTPSISDEALLKRKDKMSHCSTIVDAMCNASMKGTQEFSQLLSISIDTLLQLCNDQDSDIRMVADESLNRIIRALMDNNVGKIQLELHKEIKKNGNVRSLRAALWRFAELCHMIRPQKGKPYMASLVPCIVHISKRLEEPVLETLASSVERIFKSLGIFASDSEVKVLLKSFLLNLSSTSAVCRRSSAAAIVSICLHCKKPQIFLAWTLSTVLDSILPVREDGTANTNSAAILGALGVLRCLLPHFNSAHTLSEKADSNMMRGSFGCTKSTSYQDIPSASLDHLIQVYELCLHYSLHQDHNVVNAALECLQQLLKAPPPELLSIFLSPNGINRSHIHDVAGQSMGQLQKRSLSQISVSHSIASDDASLLLDESCTEPCRVAPKLQVVGESQSSLDSDSLIYSSTSFLGALSRQESSELLDPGPTENTPPSPLHYVSFLDTKPIQSQGGEDEDEVSSQKLEEEDKAGGQGGIPSPDQLAAACYVGKFCDQAIPLAYCTRLLAHTFLLTGKQGGIRKDRDVRVSVKALALGCIAGVVAIWPQALVLYLDKAEKEEQRVHEVLMYSVHNDPQLRGLSSLVAGSLVKSVLLLHGNSFESWSSKQEIDLIYVLRPIYRGLQGDSSVSCRQTLVTLQMCLGPLLQSQESESAVPLLSAVIPLHNNPYWLVKVRLLELLAELPYVSLMHVDHASNIQHQVVHTVFVPLLADEDSRVRHAASMAMVKVVSFLFYPTDQLSHDPVMAHAAHLSAQYLSSAVWVHKKENSTLPLRPFSLPEPFFITPGQLPHEASLEGTLSRIVSILSNTLSTSTTKHLTFGCCEALAELSARYPTTQFPRAWGCIFSPRTKKSTSKPQSANVKSTDDVHPTAGLLSTALALLTSSSISLDLSCQQWIMKLAGNLFSGMAVCCLQGTDPNTTSSGDSHEPSWACLQDSKLSQAGEHLLSHTMRILAMFSCILEESQPVMVNPKPVLSAALPSISSPIKRKGRPGPGMALDQQYLDKPPDERGSIDSRGSRGPGLGNFTNIPHYTRIYDLLKSAYTNYKLTLDAQASEKFLALLKCVLNITSQILEIASLAEIGRSAEELLSYLKVTASIEPVATVSCVQQLLKSLFGTNLSAQWHEITNTKQNSSHIGLNPSNTQNLSSFYDKIFQLPYRELITSLETRSINAQCMMEDSGTNIWPGKQHKDKRSSLLKSEDRKALATCIKLFEPMVIKALEQYTVTSDVQLQCRVLQLLSQLVQLRVNYCLLDSDKIFIGFVLKQFELIEEGQILKTDELIPRIFQFLVHLSYEKNHSKAIIGVPEVIQLCDGLMASGQSPITHCIPALVPVVEDVFLVRGGSTGSSSAAELDTQREVLVAVLLRLVEYHQVLELLAMVLYQSHHDSKERWLRWSRKVADTLIPLLALSQVRLESRCAQRALIALLDALAPCATQPVDPLLLVLFADPPPSDKLVSSERWLGALLGVLDQLLVLGNEEAVLERLEELNIGVPKNSSFPLDPLNASRPQCESPPQVVLARWMFQVMLVVAQRIHINVVCPLGFIPELDYLLEQFSHFLLYSIYMMESGSYCKVATAAIQLTQDCATSSCDDPCLPIEELNKIFLELSPFCPMLTFQWCYILVLLNYSNHKFWSQILRTKPPPDSKMSNFSFLEMQQYGPSSCCNIEFVRRGGTILFSDFVCDNLVDVEQITWLLINHIEEVVHLSNELPVKELIAAVHRNPAASGLLVQAVAARLQDLSRPSLVARLLQQCLEGVHPSQSGTLLQFLVSRLLDLPQLALSRQACALACKRAEMLLTAPIGEAESQLAKKDLQELLNKIGSKYERLRSLLLKLDAECYEVPAVEQSQNIDPESVKNVCIDRSWLLSQVKLRCCHPEVRGSDVSQMLSELDLEDILTIMGSPKFNLAVLKDCIKFGTHFSLQKISKETPYECPLYEAARTTLLHHISHIKELLPRPHQVFQPCGRTMTPKEQKFSLRLATLFSEPSIWMPILQLAEAIPDYLKSLIELSTDLPALHHANLAKFGGLCLEAAHWQVRGAKNSPCPGALEPSLTCAAIILSHPSMAQEFGLPNRHAWLSSACSSIFAVTSYLVHEEPLSSPCSAPSLAKTLEDPEHFSIAHACKQMAILVSWLEKLQKTSIKMPGYLFNPIRIVVISLARLPLLNSYAATPPEAWQHGWDVPLGGPTKTTVPPVPLDLLMETEVLEQFIFRLNLLGWTSRQQFEENWMTLLGVLSSGQIDENVAPEEATAIVEASSLAVKGITSLLVQTLLLPVPGNPGASQLVHQPRIPEQNLTNEVDAKLKTIHKLLQWRLLDTQITSGSTWQFEEIFQRRNLERVGLNSSYGYSQMSFQYLATLIKMSDNPDDSVTCSETNLWGRQKNSLAAIGLDIHSCLHFLLDLYSQWTSSQSNTPLRLLSEVVRSVLMVSDIFTEQSQYQWMLNTFLELGKNHPIEDEFLHQIISLGASKAVAILGHEDVEVVERCRKMVEGSLRSGFLPSRLCGLHGLMYLLQGNKYHIRLNSEETLQLALSYIQHNMDLASSSSSHSERHLLTLWSLIFFLLEEKLITDTEMASAILELVLDLASTRIQPTSLNICLMQGLERLVLNGTLSGKVGEQVTKLALDQLRQPNLVACIPALQLLITCMYTGLKSQPYVGEPVDADPEVLLQALEKTSALFDRIKRSYPHEGDIFCGVLPTLLSDFFPPSEMLTKVIGEFLSSQQPHPRLLAGVVFQLFERACGQDQLPLLQDWVVISLSNFTQCSPVGMAVWCLTCFFVSASTNSWLRAIFPHIQSRIGRCENEDRKLFCIAALDFYLKLSQTQKEALVSTFQAAAEPLSPFSDLIACL